MKNQKGIAGVFPFILLTNQKKYCIFTVLFVFSVVPVTTQIFLFKKGGYFFEPAFLAALQNLIENSHL